MSTWAHDIILSSVLDRNRPLVLITVCRVSLTLKLAGLCLRKYIITDLKFKVRMLLVFINKYDK